MRVYQNIAQCLEAIRNCEARAKLQDEPAKSGTLAWRTRHAQRIVQLVEYHMPSGAGFDQGTELGKDSTPDKLIFLTAFHHMNDQGFYDGWTEHKVTVRASLTSEIAVHVSGRNRNNIKDHIAETFYDCLTREAI